MPLSEFYRLAKGKDKSAQQEQTAAAAPGPSSALHGSDFVELVWENGQVMMKGQPNRVNNPSSDISTSSLADLPDNGRFRDKGAAKGENSEMGRVGMMNSTMNDFQIPGSSELDGHEDMVPWLSYHLDDETNYCSDLFTEVSGVTAIEASNHRTDFTTLEGRSEGDLAFKDSHPTSFQNRTSDEQCDLSSVRPSMSQLDRVLSLQSRCSFPSFRPKMSDGNSSCVNNTAENISSSESAQKRYFSSVHPRKKMQTRDLGQRVPSSNVMNFPHFAAMVKPGLDAISAKGNHEMPVTKKDGKDKVSVPIGGKPACPSQVPAVLSTIDGSKMSTSKSLEMLHHAGHSDNVGCQGSEKIDVSLKQAIVPKEKMAAGNVEKITEPVVVSSICSGNSVDRSSNDPTYGSKRKYNESEDSEYPSEDVEEESVGIRKAANNRVGSGSKRSRAAEVHNLSERRRRDRINEKMRALQELIPNCNKVDKASMLDEAIEYLKTLQLQVQMMSMGPGVCMPPMMLPHAAHMPRFSPMGIGMGYGLGMLDMNMNSSCYPSMQIPRFPVPPVSGFGSLNVTPLPNLPMFGFQAQGVDRVAMPVSHAPVISAPACPPNRTVDLNTAISALPSGNIGSAQISHSKETVQNVTLERRIANQAGNNEPERVVSLLKADHPSASKATEPSSKS